MNVLTKVSRVEWDVLSKGIYPHTGCTADQAEEKNLIKSLFLSPLQANLSLSPTSLLPVSKNPEAKLGEVTPTSPCVSPSPTLQLAPQTSEEEEPISFESPAEGTPLPSINKVRNNKHILQKISSTSPDVFLRHLQSN